MKTWNVIAASLFLCALHGPVLADPHKDESGHGRHGHGERKEVFWDGNCKVERKWERNGDYKEERKCGGDDRGRGHGHGHRHDRGPQVVINLPPWFDDRAGRPDYRPGWEPAPHHEGTRTVRCNSERVGQVLGGILGGVLGHQIGDGRGQTIATIGGTIAGVFIGGDIGRGIDVQNQACIAQALEFAPAGERIVWDALDDLRYAVVPGPVEQHGKFYCRAFTADVLGGGRSQQINGTACRRPDGTWTSADRLLNPS